MRLPWSRLSAALVALALLAAACADDASIDELLDEETTTTTTVVTTTTTEASDDPIDDAPTVFEIPAAPAPDPDPTPLPVDGDYRIGTLDNGLTYLLRSNDTPGGSLDLRLLVNAGSAQQEVGLDGSAHFLEHMLFNGTERFPGNELTTQLQRLGISFGADVNAYTSYDETVYLLGATTFDRTAVTVAFDVLREWASNATIDPADVVSEIGVVRDELRQGRETVDGAVFTRFEQIYTAGTDYEDRLVIGDAELVEATDAENLRAFYDTWYRPDNMAIVVVGDLPLDELENEVTSRFDNLESRVATPAQRSDVVVPLDADPVVELILQPDVGTSSISLDYQLPVWDTGTVGGERMTLIETAAALMISSRLNEAFQRGELALDNAPFLDIFAINRGLRYYGTNLRAPELDTALEQYLAQALAVARDGFTDDDVERVQGQLFASLDDELATLGSTQDAAYATALSTHWLASGPLDDAENRIARQRDVVASLTAEELTDFWRWILASSGAIVIGVGEDADAIPTSDRLREVVEQAQPAGQADAADEIDELVARPEPATIVDEVRRSSLDGGVVEWTFENGMIVSYQGTTITEGTFDVWLESSGGWSAGDDPDASLAAAAVEAVLNSGVGPHDRATLLRYLESRDVAISAQIVEEEEGLYGNSSSDDAEDLFALLHLAMTAPRVDEVALNSVARNGEALLDDLENNADLRQSIALIRLFSDGDPRYDNLLDPDEIASLDADDLRDRFADRFDDAGEFRLAVVGDIDEAVVRDLASRYLGTLPAGDTDPPTVSLTPPTTALTDAVPLLDGTANGGTVRLDWAIDRVGADDEIAGSMLATIITNRIIDTIREELGASYGGSATITPSRTGTPALTSVINVDGDPARLDEIKSALAAILAELATTGPTADEYERAEQVLLNDFNFVNDFLFLQTNMALMRFPDQDVLTPDERFATLDRTTVDDVRELANALYGDPASVQVDKVAS